MIFRSRPHHSSLRGVGSCLLTPVNLFFIFTVAFCRPRLQCLSRGHCATLPFWSYPIIFLTSPLPFWKLVLPFSFFSPNDASDPASLVPSLLSLSHDVSTVHITQTVCSCLLCFEQGQIPLAPFQAHLFTASLLPYTVPTLLTPCYVPRTPSIPHTIFSKHLILRL